MVERYEYEEAKLLSLDETLGIDPEKSRESFLKEAKKMARLRSISGIVRFRQLTGKMDKDAHRKLWIRMIIFACSAGLLAILATLFALGIFG